MRNRGDLHARLDAVENRLVSDLDRKLASLTPAERERYETWRQQCRAQLRRYAANPAEYFGSWIEGELERPELPHGINRKLFAGLTIPADFTASEASDAWRKALEQGR